MLLPSRFLNGDLDALENLQNGFLWFSSTENIENADHRIWVLTDDDTTSQQGCLEKQNSYVDLKHLSELVDLVCHHLLSTLLFKQTILLDLTDVDTTN